MKTIRLLIKAMTMLTICGIFSVVCVACTGTNHSDQNESGDAVEEGRGDDNDGVLGYEEVVVPSFVKDKLGDGDWWADTICVVGKKAYYIAYTDSRHPSVIFDNERILASDYSIRVTPIVPDCDHIFYVSVVGKTMLTDFADANSLRALSSLSKELPEFESFSFDSIADFHSGVQYCMNVDFPKPSAEHSDLIGRWLIDMISDSQQSDDGGWRYTADIHDHKKFAQSVASVYFSSIKAEWGTDSVDYPAALYSTINLHAKFFNNRYVTYQLCTHDYSGGAHGYFTEGLVSFDHVHNQEIDYDYLFKPKSEKEILNILQKVAKNSPQYEEWKPQVSDGVIVVDEKFNPTGEYSFPQPGLSDEGIVFSFQPYALSCFAAGTFHFTVPYDKVKHLLTPMGKWCIGL